MARPHNPVMPIDLLVGFGGLAILVGLALEWSDGGSGYGSLSLLKVLLVLFGVFALLEPFVLLLTRKTDVPVAWEALLLLVGAILSLVVIGKAILPPEPGFGPGFFIALGGLVLATGAVWVSVSQEK